MPATLKDIAKRTGLSVPSVCLILNGQGHKFRAQSRQAVIDAAAELKYRPDMVMRRMGRASTRRDAIGFVVQSDTPRIADPTIFEYFCGVNDALLERDQLLVTVKLDSILDDPHTRPPRLLAERFVDGLLLVEAGLPAALEKLVEHYEIMTVRLSTQRHDEHDCVYVDEEHASRTAAEHLIKLGHRRIVFVPPPMLGSDTGHRRRASTAGREQGYVGAMVEAGLPPQVMDLTTAPPRCLDELVAAITDSHATAQPITGVISSAFSIAIKLVEMLGLSHLRCPQHVSIVSAGDLHVYHDLWPTITRVSCDRYTMGQWAARMLLAKIHTATTSGGTPQPTRIYQGALVAGAASGTTCLASRLARLV